MDTHNPQGIGHMLSDSEKMYNILGHTVLGSQQHLGNMSQWDRQCRMWHLKWNNSHLYNLLEYVSQLQGRLFQLGRVSRMLTHQIHCTVLLGS